MAMGKYSALIPTLSTISNAPRHSDQNRLHRIVFFSNFVYTSFSINTSSWWIIPARAYFPNLNCRRYDCWFYALSVCCEIVQLHTKYRSLESHSGFMHKASVVYTVAVYCAQERVMWLSKSLLSIPPQIGPLASLYNYTETKVYMYIVVGCRQE